MKRLHKDSRANPCRDLETIGWNSSWMSSYMVFQLRLLIGDSLGCQRCCLCYNSNSLILEFLQLINLSWASTALNRAAMPKTGVWQCLCRYSPSFLFLREICMLWKAYYPGNFGRNSLSLPSPIQGAISFYANHKAATDLTCINKKHQGICSVINLKPILKKLLC